MGIFLRGREPGMAEQLLNCAKICAVAEQVGGERMPKRVRMNGGIARDIRGVELHNPSGAAVR